MARIFVGTSGFDYPSWKPGFYPDGLSRLKFLAYYSSHLNCVEVNYTFRRIASAATLDKWIATTPDTFLFCPKAHMRLTHILKLKDAGEATSLFLDSLKPLRDANRLGPILFQLPPSFKNDSDVLAYYLSLLPKGLHFAFEFRHESWLTEQNFNLFRQYNVALCVAESAKFEVPETVTADFVYFRLRKPEYSQEDRDRIVENAIALNGSGRDLFLFFKHEENPQGALYAQDVIAKTRPVLDKLIL